MKQKSILLLLFLICNVLFIGAQQKERRHFDIEDFKQKKATFIIEKVGLSDSESKLFIPLMNELMDKKFELNRSVRQQARDLRNKKDARPADYDRLLNESIEARIREAELEKEYSQKFRRIVSSEKILKYQRADSQFMQEAVKRRGKE